MVVNQLTKADDYPIHQTAEPIAVSGTDRYVEFRLHRVATLLPASRGL